MKNHNPALDLPIPRSKSALMQHLQTLVLRGNRWWIGGVIPAQKFENLVLKMAERYPVLRGERGRSYDRSIGVASAHFVAFGTEQGIAWWVLTSDGKGGLADTQSPDFHVAKNALAANGHIAFGDYVLLYAHKKDARTLVDAKTGKEKRIIKDCSTWTWKMTASAYNQVLTTLEKEVHALNYGDDSRPENLYGVRGVLAFQRRRPLFSGVRAQVLQLHRQADDSWSRMRKAWTAKHPRLAKEYGDRAGMLRPLGEITKKHLPKMGRLKVFDAQTLQDLLPRDSL